MQFSLSTLILSTLITLSTASTIETPLNAAIRRDVLLQERAGANGNRPVASGNCCVAKTSLKEDVCTTAAGAAGLCLPLGAGFNCNGALNCIAKSTVKCDPKVLENGRPKCR